MWARRGFSSPGEGERETSGTGFEGQFEAQDVVLHCDVGEFPIEAGKTIEDFYKNYATSCSI
jgi:hypothetical protein